MNHTALVLLAGLSAGLLEFLTIFLIAVFGGMLCSYCQRRNNESHTGDD